MFANFRRPIEKVRMFTMLAQVMMRDYGLVARLGIRLRLCSSINRLQAECNMAICCVTP
jgi:hypothetical protein